VRSRTGVVAVAAGLLLLAGCGMRPGRPVAAPTDNTADICARWLASTKPFLSPGADAAPEATAYRTAIADQYAGAGLPQSRILAIQRAYFTAQEAAPRALATEATSPRLRDALTAYADELKGRAADLVPEFAGTPSAAFTTLTAACAPAPADSAYR
jgi:hypothetical protein